MSQLSFIDVEEPLEVETTDIKVKLGDLWALPSRDGGRTHYLYCGDATNTDSIDMVMQGYEPALVAADAPYGVSIMNKDSNGFLGGGTRFNILFGGLEKARKKMKALESNPAGTLSTKIGTVGGGSYTGRGVAMVGVYEQFDGDANPSLAAWSCLLYQVLFPKAVQVWWGANNFWSYLFEGQEYPTTVCEPGTMLIVWDKQNNGDFADFEMAWTSKSGSAKIIRLQWNGMLRAEERNKKRVHPTQKPQSITPRIMKFVKTPAQSHIIVPFVGSGSDILGIEKHTDCTAHGIELSEHYTGVALRAYWSETGMKPYLRRRFINMKVIAFCRYCGDEHKLDSTWSGLLLQFICSTCGSRNQNIEVSKLRTWADTNG